VFIVDEHFLRGQWRAIRRIANADFYPARDLNGKAS
jgi:hypothetical protein